jgi:hypothetical protein
MPRIPKLAENSFCSVGNCLLHFLGFRPDCDGVPCRLPFRKGRIPRHPRRCSEMTDKFAGNAPGGTEGSLIIMGLLWR